MMDYLASGRSQKPEMEYSFVNEKMRTRVLRMPPKLPKEDEIDLEVKPFAEDLIAIIPGRLEKLLHRDEELERIHKRQLKVINFFVQKKNIDPMSEYFWTLMVEIEYSESEYTQKWMHYWLRLYEIAKGVRVLPDIQISENGVTPEQIQAAKEVPLEEIFEGDLREHGNRLMGCCPFHGEKTPSFTIFTDDNHFYCFGCNLVGDSIDYIMKARNIDMVHAVKELLRG